jgi:hypothetical protein
MVPFFSIASRDFDKDLIILKKVLHQFAQRTHSLLAHSDIVVVDRALPYILV